MSPFSEQRTKRRARSKPLPSHPVLSLSPFTEAEMAASDAGHLPGSEGGMGVDQMPLEASLSWLQK